MLNYSRISPLLMFLASVSTFGIVTTLMLTMYPPKPFENVWWRKPLVGSFFALICVSGIMAVFFPESCGEGFGVPENKARSMLDAEKNTSLTERLSSKL
jgi:hypothetical protein